MKWYEQLQPEQLYTILNLFRNKELTDYDQKLSVIIKTLIELIETWETVPTGAVAAPDPDLFHEELMREFKQNLDQERKARSTTTTTWMPKRYTGG